MSEPPTPMMVTLRVTSIWAGNAMSTLTLIVETAGSATAFLSCAQVVISAVVGTGETEGAGLGRKVGVGEGSAVGEESRRRRAGAVNGSPTITDEAAAGAAESPTITEGADKVVAATAGTGRESARAAAAAVLLPVAAAA